MVLLVLVFGMAARTPLDADVWWHLRAGQESWQRSAPLTVDLFSYTCNQMPWNNHSWLTEIIMFLMYRAGGYAGIGLFVALSVTAMTALLFIQMDEPVFIRTTLLLFAGVVSAPNWSPRPQLISFLCLALLSLLIRRVNPGKWMLWVLPGIFILWSNLHGGYFLGLLYLGAVLTGKVISWFFDSESSPSSLTNPYIFLGGAIILCMAAVAINPLGIKVWSVPLETIDASVLQFNISEWDSPNFHESNQIPFLIYLIMLVAFIALVPEPVKLDEVLPIVGFLAMALYSRRAIAPFVVISIPLLSSRINLGWAQVKKNWRHKFFLARNKSDNKNHRIINLSLVGVLWMAALIKLFFVTNPIFVEDKIQEMYPQNAIDVLLSTPVTGNLLNEYDWGGFLIWRAPGRLVFADGRADLFGAEILNQWAGLVQAQPGWEQLVEKNSIDTVLLYPDRPLVEVLSNQGWQYLYRDSNAVLLRKP